jgi:glutaredoxin 3
MTPSIKIYSTGYCPFCRNAKALFNQLSLPFEDISLDHDPETWERLSKENGGWRTVPMIFVGEKFLGGYTDVAQLHAKGKLLPLVNGEET